MIDIAMATAWLLSLVALAAPILRLALRAALTVAALVERASGVLTPAADLPPPRTADVVPLPTHRVSRADDGASGARAAA